MQAELCGEFKPLPRRNVTLAKLKKFEISSPPTVRRNGVYGSPLTFVHHNPSREQCQTGMRSLSRTPLCDTSTGSATISSRLFISLSLHMSRRKWSHGNFGYPALEYKIGWSMMRYAGVISRILERVSIEIRRQTVECIEHPTIQEEQRYYRLQSLIWYLGNRLFVLVGIKQHGLILESGCRLFFSSNFPLFILAQPKVTTSWSWRCRLVDIEKYYTTKSKHYPNFKKS